MFMKCLIRKLNSHLLKKNAENKHNISRNLTLNASLNCKKPDDTEKFLVVRDGFENITNKNKETYLDMVKIFEKRDVHRRGHVEFIYSALRHMETFNVHRDLEVYKSLVDVLPKGKFIPTNIFQAEFMHYPKQQQCIIDLLQQMEDNGVIPDFEMEDILMNIFGRRGYPLRKFWRMMYWMPKFKNLSPWPLPDTMPTDNLELAKLAIARICSVDLQSEVSVYQSSDIEDSVDDTWIVSAQSPTQRELLQKHDKTKPMYVEGSFRVWLKNLPVNYFVLRADPTPIKQTTLADPDDVSGLRVPVMGMAGARSEVCAAPSVHEQDEGTILAVCATGTSSKDSLLSWVRHLEGNGNGALGMVPVVFTLRSGANALSTVQ